MTGRTSPRMRRGRTGVRPPWGLFGRVRAWRRRGGGCAHRPRSVRCSSLTEPCPAPGAPRPRTRPGRPACTTRRNAGRGSPGGPRRARAPYAQDEGSGSTCQDSAFPSTCCSSRCSWFATVCVNLGRPPSFPVSWDLNVEGCDHHPKQQRNGT